MLGFCTSHLLRFFQIEEKGVGTDSCTGLLTVNGASKANHLRPVCIAKYNVCVPNIHTVGPQSQELTEWSYHTYAHTHINTGMHTNTHPSSHAINMYLHNMNKILHLKITNYSIVHVE